MCFQHYSLFVYFGNKSSEGAERLRGLTLYLWMFIFFLGYVIYFYNPVSVPQEESGQKRQKKCIGSEMSEKTISLFRLFWTVFTFSKFRDGIQSKFTRFIEGDRHWIVKRGDNVVKTYGICKNLSNSVPIPSFQKRHLFKIYWNKRIDYWWALCK